MQATPPVGVATVPPVGVATVPLVGLAAVSPVTTGKPYSSAIASPTPPPSAIVVPTQVAVF